MTKNIKHLAGSLIAVCETMNERINEIGQIPRSDLTIKTWHDYDNSIWEHILECVVELEPAYPVPKSLQRDIKTLLDHIDYAGHLADNILYPTIDITRSLPKRATELVVNDKIMSVKSLTFRTMMNIRELYCSIIDLDLPNEDSSQGLLDPTPTQQLFSFS